MKILSAVQIRAADAFTIKHEPIASIDLMERASQVFCDWFVDKLAQGKPVMVFCGIGNNGGDGLAIARMLLQMQYEVRAFIVRTKQTGSPDFEVNLQRFAAIGEVNFLKEVDAIPNIPDHTTVIDAMFGSGLSRPVEGLHADVIKAINNSKATVVAIDIASGLFSDRPSTGNAIVKPDYTVTFQMAKLAFMMPENAAFTGQLTVVDIGLSKEFIGMVETPHYLLEQNLIRPCLRLRKKFAHKGDFGKVLLVSGSWGKIGATVLCAKACLRTGVGLLTIHAPICAYDILQSTVPEAMVDADDKKKKITSIKNIDQYDAIGVGPGIGTAEATKAVLTALLKRAKTPMVLDADALNILGKHKQLLKYIPKNSILTPHPKEFERIAGKFDNSFERLSLQKQFSRKHQCITVIKGAHTAICAPSGEVYFNSTGNPGMATGGSGDALTGMLAALLGQGYPPMEATIIGVYMHGLAGDKAVEKLGQEAMLPSDLIENIAAAYQTFYKSSEKD